MNLCKLKEGRERVICYLASLQVLYRNLEQACGESRIESQLRKKFENYIATLQTDFSELRDFLTEVQTTEGNLKDLTFLLELNQDYELSKTEGNF